MFDIESEKHFEQFTLGNLSQSQEIQIGLLPLKQRFRPYVRTGF
ncbi:MAG: hypothetical protein ACRER2_13590 [Methylococcales bacterium]